jgi:tetratricopeptide (TPR) repeat protein
VTSDSNLRRGDLSEVPFSELLWGIHRAKLTGFLELEREDQGKQIFFEDGYPIYAKSNLRQENLGRQLAREGLLTAEQEKEARARASGEAKPLARVLLDMAVLDPSRLHEQMRKNLVFQILQCFSWEEGAYRFAEDPFSIEAVIASRMSAVRLILEGARRMLPEVFLDGERGIDPGRLFSLDRDVAAEAGAWKLKGPEVELLHSLATPRTPADLAGATGRGLDEVRRDLYAFRVLGLLAEGKRELSLDELAAESLLKILRTPEPPSPAAGANEAAREAGRRLAADHLRLMGSDFFELLGVGEEASTEEVEKAYGEFMQRFAPSLLSEEAPEEDRERLEEIRAKAGKARAVLSDPGVRGKYLETLRPPEPKTEFDRGVCLLGSRKYPEAVQAFSRAREADAQNPTFQAYWGWAVFLESPDGAVGEAETALRAARKHLRNPHAAFFLGKFLLANGRTEEAIRHLRAALDLSPKSPGWLEELARAKTWQRKQAKF